MGGLRAVADFGLGWHYTEVNGQPGAILRDRDGGLVGVMALDITEGQIQGISSVVNPDKLQHLGTVGDVRALLRERRLNRPD